MTGGHSPGPWNPDVLAKESRIRLGEILVFEPAEARPVAIVRIPSRAGYETAVADARLIAAAPRLFALLQTLLATDRSGCACAHCREARELIADLSPKVTP